MRREPGEHGIGIGHLVGVVVLAGIVPSRLLEEGDDDAVVTTIA